MKKPSRPKSDYSIQTVTNALRLLEAFSEKDELGVSELSRNLDLHKNNVFRLLATLEERGYIEQCSKNDRYRLGSRCFQLGQSFARGRTLLVTARPALEALSAESGESAHLAVLRGFDVVHLDSEVASRLVATTPRIGMSLPAHCTALGKVLLGCADDELRQAFDDEVVAVTGLDAHTPNTITDREKFFEHLRSVRVQGFATDLEEFETGLRCVAAPVFDRAGGVLAALSLSMPEQRASDDQLLGDLASKVVAAAHRVSEGLGQLA
ncbi:MAG: IclR family transcriptional regulator [Myxococcota bacterium]